MFNRPFTKTFKHKSRVQVGKVGGRIFVYRTKKKVAEMEKKLKQPLQGKLTYVSLAIGALSVIFRAIGKEFPEDEVNLFLNWANSSWPMLVEGFSLMAAAYGRARREWREE